MSTEREELIEAATWALIEYDTDTADRGVSKEHYQERRADVERVLAVVDGYRKQEPVTDVEVVAAYQRLIAAARFKAEWRWPIPINYLPGDAEHTTLVALRHAYVLGVGDADALAEGAGYRKQEPVSEPTEAEVEAVAWSLANIGSLAWAEVDVWGGSWQEWRDRYRAKARAALVAARAVTNGEGR